MKIKPEAIESLISPFVRVKRVRTDDCTTIFGGVSKDGDETIVIVNSNFGEEIRIYIKPKGSSYEIREPLCDFLCGTILNMSNKIQYYQNRNFRSDLNSAIGDAIAFSILKAVNYARSHKKWTPFK